MNNNIYISDIQGYRLNRGYFIVKEFSFLENGNVIRHYIFKPPFSKFLLNFEDNRIVNYLSKNYHGLEWRFGFTPYKFVKKILFDNFSSNNNNDKKIIYVKGNEKVDWFYQLMNIDKSERINCSFIIRNIELDYKDIISLKRYNNIDDKNKIMICKNHNKHCALSNVFLLFSQIRFSNINRRYQYIENQ